MSSSNSDAKIAWYPGVGPRVSDLYQGELLGVSSAANQATGVYTVNLGDIDSDGDLDVVWGGGSVDQVGWFENDNASQPFRPLFSGRDHVIACNATGARVVLAGDIDGDGYQGNVNSYDRGSLIAIASMNGL